ncbi:hypothetical protein KJA13_01215 [Patescibacteria group bacterium]|nr:hypothetical protein [Patescibacteria group bacterium]
MLKIAGIVTAGIVFLLMVGHAIYWTIKREWSSASFSKYYWCLIIGLSSVAAVISIVTAIRKETPIWIPVLLCIVIFIIVKQWRKT